MLCGAERIMREVGATTDEAVALIGASMLPAEMKRTYVALVRARAASLRR